MGAVDVVVGLGYVEGIADALFEGFAVVEWVVFLVCPGAHESIGVEVRHGYLFLHEFQDAVFSSLFQSLIFSLQLLSSVPIAPRNRT